MPFCFMEFSSTWALNSAGSLGLVLRSPGCYTNQLQAHSETSAYVVLPGVGQGPALHVDLYCSMVAEWTVLVCKPLPVHDKIRTATERTHLETFRVVGHCCYSHTYSRWTLLIVHSLSRYSLGVIDLMWWVTCCMPESPAAGLDVWVMGPCYNMGYFKLNQSTVKDIKSESISFIER